MNSAKTERQPLTPEQEKRLARDKHFAEIETALEAEKARGKEEEAAFRNTLADFHAKEKELAGKYPDKASWKDPASPYGKEHQALADAFAQAQWKHNVAKTECAYQIANLEFALRSIDITYKQELVDKHIILSVDHLKQFFSMGGDSKTKAVHDVSFQIKEGECFGLVGESGCGKTTTGRCIIKLYDITSGAIYYKGYRISGGTRWHEKEIKWSKIHTKEKIAALRNKEADEISAIPLKSIDLQNQIADLAREEADEIKEKNDPSNDDNDALIASVQAEYAKRLEELNVLLDAAKGSEEEQAKAIRTFYEGKVQELNAQEKEHLQEQKDAIRHIKYDNSHINSLRVCDQIVLPKLGEKAQEAPSHRLINEIQMIFQDPVDSLDPRMTVDDIIQEGLRIQGHYNKNENEQKVAEMLDKVGLIPEYASRYPHEFSGGQRQRIGIARALVMNPRFLICDEPISALDVSIRAQILNLLNDVKEEMGITIMFIAHDLSVVKYFCDRIAVMYYGNMVELASSDELFRHPLHPYTKSLLSAIPKPDPISEKNRIRLVYQPGKVHDYSKEKPTFQEILPGHFVLANSVEMAKYREEIQKLDAAALSKTAPGPKAN